MSLYDTKSECKMYASLLPKKYEDYDIDELANGYCKALDEQDSENMNIYLSALILRFWYQIDRMYNKVKTFGADREDLFDKLYECISVACEYRAWQNPEKHTNAQACIMQVLSSRGVPVIVWEAGLQKNTHASLSLDDPISDDGDDTFGDTLADENIEIIDNAKQIIQSMIYKNKIVEAIVADTIAYNDDVFKKTKKTIKTLDEEGKEYKYVEHSSEFWPFKVVQALNELNDEYIRYFCKKYSISEDVFGKAIESLNKSNNQKKYKIVANSLNTIKAFV